MAGEIRVGAAVSETGETPGPVQRPAGMDDDFIIVGNMVCELRGAAGEGCVAPRSLICG